MGLKSIYDLNREFQAQILQERGRDEDTELRGDKTAVKSLNELNLEFHASQVQGVTNQSGRTAAHESMAPIKPLVIEIDEIDDLNRLQDVSGDIKKNDKKKKWNVFTVISDILFCLALFTALVAILTTTPHDGPPKTFFGYSYFTVLTPSMQSEIPKGSFILVRKTGPEELEVGDNITFLKENNTTVTHKIVDIYDNYQDSGLRGFETKGVNNANPDKDIVHESNIVGKVIFSVPKLGAAIVSLKENIYIVFVIFGLCIILSFLLRGLFSGDSSLSETKKTKKTKM